MRKSSSYFLHGLAVAVCVTALGAGWQWMDDVESSSPTSDTTFLTSAESAVGGLNVPSQAAPPAMRFEVLVRRPEGPPKIELITNDPLGRTTSVACSTCHSIRQPNRDNRSPEMLDEFHQGMQFDHGRLACYACHNPEDSDSLHGADGTVIAFSDVMILCSQCHSSQAIAFEHGAHGGMNGFWDLTRGPQTKNNCIDCHDPHAPRYPKMIVGFKPRDRFLERDKPHATHN